MLLATATRTRPVRLPDALNGEGPSALVCYRPERPAMFVPGTRGFALNLASRRAQVGALSPPGAAACPIRRATIARDARFLALRPSPAAVPPRRAGAVQRKRAYRSEPLPCRSSEAGHGSEFLRA